MREVSQGGRGIVLGVAALVSLCLAASGSASSRVDGLTINVSYGTNSLAATLSNGTVLSSGTTVPPGPYSIVVYDSSDLNPQFTVSGPGASVSSDLDPDGMGIEIPMTFGPFVLEPSADYTISDPSLGQGSSISFVTSATGSSASSSPTGPTSSGGSSSNGSSASSGSSPSGSAGAKTLGTLALSVGANGKPVFTIEAKPVKTLKPGRYGLITGNSSKKAGLFIGHGTRVTTLRRVGAVGASADHVEPDRREVVLRGLNKGPRRLTSRSRRRSAAETGDRSRPKRRRSS